MEKFEGIIAGEALKRLQEEETTPAKTIPEQIVEIEKALAEGKGDKNALLNQLTTLKQWHDKETGADRPQ